MQHTESKYKTLYMIFEDGTFMLYFTHLVALVLCNWFIILLYSITTFTIKICKCLHNNVKKNVPSVQCRAACFSAESVIFYMR